MAFSAPGRRRRYFPQITHLEARSLLAAVVTCLGQDGHDLVGPDASQGSDGIQDLHLQLSGLAAAVSQIVVQAPGGFEWATEPDPDRGRAGGVFSFVNLRSGRPLYQPTGQERPGLRGDDAAVGWLDGKPDPVSQWHGL